MSIIGPRSIEDKKREIKELVRTFDSLLEKWEAVPKEQRGIRRTDEERGIRPIDISAALNLRTKYKQHLNRGDYDKAIQSLQQAVDLLKKALEAVTSSE